MEGGGLANSRLAIPAVLRLKAQASSALRMLRGCAGGAAGEHDLCAAVCERLLGASPEGVAAWLL